MADNQEDALGGFWGPIVAGQVRHLLTVAAGMLVANGALQSSQESQFINIGVGLAMWLIVAGWSWWQKVGQKRAQELLAKGKPAAKAVAAFLAIGAALALSFPGQAHALVRHHRVHVSQAVPAPTPDPRPLFDVVNCIGSTNLPIGCKPNPVVAAATPSPTTVKENILATAPADIQYAIQLATQANTPQSNVRKMCYQAILAAIPQTPSGTLPPGPDVVTHIEQGSELLDSLQPNSPVFVNCAGAAALAGQAVLTFVNAVVTGIAGIAVVAPKIP